MESTEMPNHPEEPTEVSPVEEWRQRGEGVLLTFPSGLTARVRKVKLDELVEAGLVPDSLTGMVQRAIEMKATPQMEELTSEQLQDALRMLNACALLGFIEPKVVDDLSEKRPPKNAVGVSEIDLDDKAFFFQWCQGGTRNLELFREQQKKSMEMLYTRQDVQRPTKRRATPRKKVRSS